MPRLTRRSALALLAAPAFAAVRPLITLYSPVLRKLHYADLGGIVRDLGFDACDLGVLKGGHVLPERAPADLVRAIECLTGAGLAVPMITTGLTSGADPFAVNVVGISGHMGIRHFRTAPISLSQGPNLTSLISIGRAYGVQPLVPNAESTADLEKLVAPFDPSLVALCLDPARAPKDESWRRLLPRVKAVLVQDVDAEGKMCPLGKGVVKWPAILEALAASRFTGPLTLQIEYPAAQELSALSGDLVALKRLVQGAYGS